MASNRSMLAEAELLVAFRERGCPICRVKAASARRYIAHLLWENVNDLETRTHLARSLGFCPEHTWQLYLMEIKDQGSETAVGIIYADLVGRVVAGLRSFAAQLPAAAFGDKPSRRGVWSQAREALGMAADLSVVRPEGILPSEPCRPCEFARESEQSDLTWLVEACAEDAFRARYAASDGLCLNHLRQALEISGAGYPAVAQFLTEMAVQRLSVLAEDLEEYVRKKMWQYHEEVITPGEQDAPRCATQFFGGPGLLRGEEPTEKDQPA